MASTKSMAHVVATLPICIGDLKQDLEISLFLCTILFYYTLSNDFTNFLYNRPRLLLSLCGFDLPPNFFSKIMFICKC
jgi:hypothetical protein